MSPPPMTGPADGGRRLKRGATAGLAFVARAVQQVSALALVILAAGVMGPAEYGVYTLATVFVMLLQTLTYSGLYQYVVAAKGDEAEALDTSFWLMMGIASAGAALLYLASPLVSMLFRNEQIGEVLRWLALVQPVAGAVAWISAVYMREERLQSFYTIMLAQNVTAMILGVALLLWWQSVFALVAYRYIRTGLGAVLYFGFTRVWPGLTVRLARARHAMSYASGLYGSRFVSVAATYAGDILLGIFMSTAEAGIYRFGARLAGATMDVVIQPLKMFALTRFAAEERAGRPLGPSIEAFWSTSLVLLGCGAGAIAILAEPMIRSFFKPEYLPAVVVASAFAARGAFSLGEIYVEPFLAAKARTGVAMTYGSVVTACIIGAVALSAPFGLAALSWAQAGVMLAASVAGIILITRMEPVSLWRTARRGLEIVLLVALFAAALIGLRRAFADAIPADQLAVLVTIAAGGVAGLMALGVAYLRGLFQLKVFSN